MWVSNYWYKKLPMLYLLAALLVLLLLGSNGIFSALLLTTAAALTRWWRTGKGGRLTIAEDGRRPAARKTRTGAVKRSA